MFGLFKSDPSKKLNDQLQNKLREAMEAQRNGDMRLYAELSEYAEGLRLELEKLKATA